MTENSGVIACFTSTLAALGSETFICNNTSILSTFVVLLSVVGYAGTGIPVVRSGSITGGSFTVTITNVRETVALNSAVKVSLY
jgi:hypothetical protein